MSFLCHVMHTCPSDLLMLRACKHSACHTCEFLAEGRCNRGSFDQRCFADGLQVLYFRDTVVVNKVIVLFGSGEGAVDLVG